MFVNTTKFYEMLEKETEWFGEIYYYFSGFPRNKIPWVVVRKIPWKIKKEKDGEHLTKFIIFFFSNFI